jgi:Flp pilus assembly protein TadB
MSGWTVSRFEKQLMLSALIATVVWIAKPLGWQAWVLFFVIALATNLALDAVGARRRNRNSGDAA